MIIPLKLRILTLGIPQYRVAVALGLDPTKLSRIIQERVEPSQEERRKIAEYLNLRESEVFSGEARV